MRKVLLWTAAALGAHATGHLWVGLGCNLCQVLAAVEMICFDD